MTAPAPRSSFAIRHDLLVPLVALALLGAGAFARGALGGPPRARVLAQGLRLEVPSGWIPSRAITPSDPLPARATFTPFDEAGVRLDLAVLPRPAFGGPLQVAVDLSRAKRWGELYKRLDTDPAFERGGRVWVRTTFTYATKLHADDVPRVLSAVEYAAVNGERLYVVSVHGPGARVEALERELLGTLRLE